MRFPRLLVAGATAVSLAAVPSAAVALTDAPGSPAAPPPSSAGNKGDSRSLETSGGTVLVSTTAGRFTRVAQVDAPEGVPSTSTYPVGFLAVDVDKVKKGSAFGLSLQLPSRPTG